MEKRPHAVVVPYPCTGHINPALQIARLLHRHGVYVTFVSTEHNHRRVLAVAGAESSKGGGGFCGVEEFRFETIPDGLPEAARGAQDYGRGLSMSTSTQCAAPFRELLVRLNDGTADGGVPPVTCVVPTALMSFALDVAHELGLPTMVFWGCSAAALMAHMRIRDLVRRGYVPLKDDSYLTNGYLEKTVIDWIPGMPPISLGDISSYIRTSDPDDFSLRFTEEEVNNCTKAGALIINTFDDLEADVLAALSAEYPRIFTIGTLGSLIRHHLVDDDADADAGAASSGLSLWRKDTECLTWLDTKEPHSVVYLSFGSHAVLTPEQLAEFAWGLAMSDHPFLLSTRDNMVRGGGTVTLPPEFIAATAGRCRLTTWCPQEQVLRHASVGCFVTHSGWNSMCESIAAGVPMVCWPGFADQYTNCKYACEAWGIGIRLGAEVSREQVAAHVRQVMEAAKMQRSAARWKTKAEAAALPGGTSYQNLHNMVAALVDM